MIKKQIIKLELKKDRYEWMLDCNKQYGTDYKFLVHDERYFNITNLNQDQTLDLVNSLNKIVAGPKKKIRIHTVRNPFYSRMSQFEEGRQSLSIGIDVACLRPYDVYKIYIGNNKNVYYKIDVPEAIRLSEEYKSVWTNPRGIRVAILPLKDFKKVEKNIKSLKKDQDGK